MRVLFLSFLVFLIVKESLAKTAVVPADDILKLIARGKGVALQGVTIEGDLDFTRLPAYKTGIANAEVLVNVPIYFEKCRFKGKIIAFKERKEILVNAHFRFNLSLVECVLYDELNLRSSRIEGVFSLAGSELNGTLHAENLSVQTDSFFGSTLFAREVNFQNTRFQGRAGFSNARFNEVVYFQSCRFAEEALFRESVFEKSVDFSLSRFNGLLSLDYSQIQGKVLLQSCLFFSNLQITEARFSGLYLEESLFFNQPAGKLIGLPGVYTERVKFL